MASRLDTTVLNPSARAQSYPFLGGHGVTLEPYGQFTVPGDLASAVASRRNRAHFRGLEAALETGCLAIVSTPAVHLYDPARGQTKALRLNNGAFGQVDPCWGEFSSSGAHL